MSTTTSDITDLLGKIPHRVAFAGGWIDLPFCSEHDPKPPGSMVVAQVETEFAWMPRSGICSSTRDIAMDIWNGEIPKDKTKEELVEELFWAENKDKKDPSGVQDMVGLIYPGISRLDFDFKANGGSFPTHIETCNDPKVAQWLSDVLYVVTIQPRPDGYYPLDIKNLDPDWIRRLGQSGTDCFDGIVAMDIEKTGQSFNECMLCWEAIMPGIVRHHTIKRDLLRELKFYQDNYPGAMFSGCGGGYFYVLSDTPVPGGFQVKVRTDPAMS